MSTKSIRLSEASVISALRHYLDHAEVSPHAEILSVFWDAKADFLTITYVQPVEPSQ